MLTEAENRLPAQAAAPSASPATIAPAVFVIVAVPPTVVPHSLTAVAPDACNELPIFAACATSDPPVWTVTPPTAVAGKIETACPESTVMEPGIFPLSTLVNPIVGDC